MPSLSLNERVGRRFQVFNFFVQIGWLDEAARELQGIRQAFPGEKENVEAAEQNLQKRRAVQQLEEIQMAQAAGQHQAVRKLLKAFPEKDVDEKLLSEVRSLRDRYETAEKAWEQTRSLLQRLPRQVSADADRRLFTEAAAAIGAEVNLDHFLVPPGAQDQGRLELFLSQARQAALSKDGKKVSAESLLSLAVSGWLLGSAAADPKPDTARKLWRARQLVVAYLKTADIQGRQQLLANYQQQTGLTVEEMAQLISQLPPLEPPEQIDDTQPMERTAGSGVSTRTTYQVLLPPEYHPGHSYPVLIVLHHAGEGGKDMIRRWEQMTRRYGYILAAPDWSRGVGSVSYSYTPQEHAIVLDTLRDLRQHFAVDSDRVFLSGFGEGGNMAYDVGLSHPDLFAGVLPISGQPRYHARRYWPNGKYLPFYIVWGEFMGWPDDPGNDGNKANTQMFTEWIPEPIPCSASGTRVAAWNGLPENCRTPSTGWDGKNGPIPARRWATTPTARRAAANLEL